MLLWFCPMSQVTCHRCKEPITFDDTVSLDGERIGHLDCRRPRDLTYEERDLLFKYCLGHVVAVCEACGHSCKPQELAWDLLGKRSYLCPGCRAELTTVARTHLYSCAMLPSEVRRRAREAREATQKLVKQSQEIAARSDVLMREAEASIGAASELLPEVRAALAALRETMQGVAVREDTERAATRQR